jgi:hypothetical protein
MLTKVNRERNQREQERRKEERDEILPDDVFVK